MNLSKNQLDKLGERIAMSKNELCQQDIDMLQEYRKTFKDPLANVFSELKEAATKVDSQCIVTYRIKRIDTIIRKLRRYYNHPNGRMSLSSIGDIAGCRCIILRNDNKKIYKIRDLLVKKYGNNIIGSEKHDYIENPKDSGYRSLHLYIKDPISNRKVEIQLRTIEQHNWATLVEIIDLVFNKKIKEGQISKDLQRFLFLFSKKDNLTRREIDEVIKIEKRKNIYKQMCKIFSRNYLNIRKQWISEERKGNYLVIEAAKDLKSTITAFGKYEEAESDYYKKYMQYRESNIVLIHVREPKFEQISKAYSNYILAMHSFFEDYKTFIESQVLEGIKNVSRIKLWRAWNLYREHTILYVKTLTEELSELRKCANNNKISNKHKKEWSNNLSYDIHQWQQSTTKFIKKQSEGVRGDKLSNYIINYQLHSLGKQLSKYIYDKPISK